MATCIHSSRSGLPPFYTIPIFPLFKLKHFFITCILSITVLSDTCMYIVVFSRAQIAKG